jgi:signal transduction histidine kinase
VPRRWSSLRIERALNVVPIHAPDIGKCLQMAQAAKLDRLRPLIIALGILAIGILHNLTPRSQALWHGIFQHLFVLPVVIAGLYFGWRGGLAAAAFAVVCFLPHVVNTNSGNTIRQGYLVDQIAEMIDIVAIGLIIGILADLQSKQKRVLERTTRQLSAVYRELQENFERLKRSERLYAIGQLSAGFAHELRNPLASVLGAAGVLQRKQATEEKQRECLDIVVKETHRLNHLLTRFLDFARPRPPHYQLLNAGFILDSVIELAAHAVDRRPIVLRKHVEPEMPALECDPEQLKQVLLNLVINAIQAMPNGGEVLISAYAEDEKAVIAVRDQGSGVRSEDLDRIFDPFFTTKESGTGLGLSVAHQIVAQHGGVLAAAVNADRGMTFTVRLPFGHREAT